MTDGVSVWTATTLTHTPILRDIGKSRLYTSTGWFCPDAKKISMAVVVSTQLQARQLQDRNSDGSWRAGNPSAQEAWKIGGRKIDGKCVYSGVTRWTMKKRIL